MARGVLGPQCFPILSISRVSCLGARRLKMVSHMVCGMARGMYSCIVYYICINDKLKRLRHQCSANHLSSMSVSRPLICARRGLLHSLPLAMVKPEQHLAPTTSIRTRCMHYGGSIIPP
jgi:hypothetical protein